MNTTKNQFIATAIVNIVALAHGCGLGWSSPAIPYFGSYESHLEDKPATAGELSWIGSCVSIGALVATVGTGFIADRIGKKNTLVLLTLPNLIFWVIVYLAKEVNDVIIARFIAGMTGGGIFRILGLYTADIAENHLRGTFGSIFPLTMYSGMLIMFILGSVLNFMTIPLIMLVIPISAFILTLYLPETPHFLIERRQFDRAIRSLRFYRSCKEDSSDEHFKRVEDEFEILKNGVLNATNEKLHLRDFTTKEAKFGLSIGIFLVFLLTFSGNTVIMMYTAYIFTISGSAMQPNDAAIVIAAMQILGIILMGIFVDRIGRKILMIISCGGSAVMLILQAIYLLYAEDGTDLSHMDWAPIVLISLAIISQSIGISSLPFVMISELVPFRIREPCTLFCMILVAVFMFTTLKMFPETVNAVGLSAVFWFFGIVCLVGFFIAIFFMPETKGKDLFEEETNTQSST